MLRQASSIAPLLGWTLLSAAGCDTSGTITFAPELEATFGFEGDLGSWEPRLVGVAPATSGAVAAASPVSEGTGAARITVDSPGGGGAVWLQRAFELAPEVRYDVELVYDVASSDGSADDFWTVLAGVSGTEPEPGALPAAGNTGRGNAGQPVWETRTRTVRVQAGSEGRLWVVLGIASGSPGTRTYAFDAVRVRFERVRN
jgi:hypothetical protein